MKTPHITIILWLVACLGVAAQDVTGITVTDRIVPTSDADTYPTHEAKYGKGGLRTVATVEERDAIPTARREAGMVVYVQEDSTYYAVGTGITNWVLFTGGSSATGVGLELASRSVLAGFAVTPELVGKTVATLGYTAAGDGGGLKWILSTDIQAEDFLHITSDADGTYQWHGIGWDGNVLAAGAKGDGVTDDSAAVQAAFNYATNFQFGSFPRSGNTILTMPARSSGSNYVINSTVYSHGVSFDFSGAVVTTQMTNGVLFDLENRNALYLGNPLGAYSMVARLPALWGPTGGETNPTTAVRIANVAGGEIVMPAITSFGTALLCSGTGGTYYNRIYSGPIRFVGRGVILQNTNANDFVNGNVFTVNVNNEASPGVETGREIVVFDNAIGASMNANVFENCGFEGFASSRVIVGTNTSRNLFRDCRFEKHSTGYTNSAPYAEWFSTSGELGIVNKIVGGQYINMGNGLGLRENGLAYGNSTSGEDVDVLVGYRSNNRGVLALTHSLYNSVNLISLYTPATTSSNARPVAAPAEWQVGLAPAYLRMKNTADTNPRLQIDAFDGGITLLDATNGTSGWYWDINPSLMSGKFATDTAARWTLAPASGVMTWADGAGASLFNITPSSSGYGTVASAKTNNLSGLRFTGTSMGSASYAGIDAQLSSGIEYVVAPFGVFSSNYNVGEMQGRAGIFTYKNSGNTWPGTRGLSFATQDTNETIRLRVGTGSSTYPQIQVDLAGVIISDVAGASRSESAVLEVQSTAGFIRVPRLTDAQYSATSAKPSGSIFHNTTRDRMMSVGATDLRPMDSQDVTIASRGDVDLEITAASPFLQLFNTTLTANRAVTFTTSGMPAGRRYKIARTGLGAFTLDVGGLKTIPSATAATVEVVYDGSSMVVIGYEEL